MEAIPDALLIVHVPNREKTIVNRLKTKVKRVVDDEVQQIERVERANAVERAAAAARYDISHSLTLHRLTQSRRKKQTSSLAEARKAEKAARSYDLFLNPEVDEEEEASKTTYSSVREMEEDFM